MHRGVMMKEGGAATADKGGGGGVKTLRWRRRHEMQRKNEEGRHGEDEGGNGRRIMGVCVGGVAGVRNLNILKTPTPPSQPTPLQNSKASFNRSSLS